jgi:[ribosomal protein S18]-alanine N-acetyltransferase
MSAVLAPRLEFVPMRDGDIDAVVEAERRIYAFPWTRGNFVDSLKAGHSVWICREGGDMVGYAAMMTAVDEAHLLNLSILPEQQRRGLGSEFLSHLMGLARVYGATRMLLEVRPGNASGIALYRRFLFSEIGRRRGYYQAENGREDAIVMAREL